MTIEVELPDGSVVEFPDGTSQKTMEMALARYRQPAARPVVGGMTKGHAPSANDSAFANLIAGKKAPRAPATYNLTGVPGVSTQIGGFLDAAQHHGMNALHGLAQLGVHGLEAVGIAPRGTAAADDAAMAKREADYQARTAGNMGANIGAVPGEILPWVTGLGELRAAGLLPTVTATGLKGAAIKGGLLAGEGALMGAATPVTDGDFGRQKAEQIGVGTVLAPLAAAGIKGVGALGSGARRVGQYLTPGGREALANERLAQQFGDTPDILTALRNPSPVEGFNLSPAQALGTPEAVQAERILRNQRDTAPLFAQADANQNAALRQQVAQIAGTPETGAAARRARAEATGPVFNQLSTARADPLPILTALDTLSRSGLGQGKNVRGAINEIQSGIQQQVENGSLNADVLSGIRERLNSYLGPMATAQEKTALVPIKDAIVDALDTAVPGYRDNLASYARLSAPIKDMAIGRELLSAIDNSRLDAAGNPVVDLTKVRSALAKARKSEHPPSNQAIKQLENVMRAIQQRGITANQIAASGPATAADLLRSMQGGLLERTVRSVPLAGPVTAELGGLLGTDISKRAGRKAVSAQATADAIEAARRRNPQSLLPQYGLPAYLLPFVEP